MHTTFATSARLFAIATAVGTVGALATAVPAQALPPMPLAPPQPCSFTKDTLVALRSDGQMATPDTQVGGTNMGPKGTLFDSQQGPFTEFDKTAATVTGNVHDYHVSFTMNYPGRSEQYEGETFGDGHVEGWIQYTNPQINWSTPAGTLKCTSETVAGTYTVTDDVDVYDIPDGDNGKKLGFLKAGTQVRAVDGKCTTDAFCHVTGPDVPGGIGYAWGQFLKPA